jgi:hypothetical protein
MHRLLDAAAAAADRTNGTQERPEEKKDKEDGTCSQSFA